MNLFCKIVILSLCISLSAASLASQSTVRILIRDHERLPLIGATVQLNKTGDNQNIYSSTDQNGIALFEALENTLYHINVRYLGYLPLEQSITVTAQNRTFEFQLKEDAISLGEVTVTARRPLIRQEDDKMIIDPEPLVNISTNTLEILEKTPGLFVDQDGGVFLGTAAPAAIYINGREQKMSPQDITTILRSLPPGNVLQIEVMRTPSTRYDASSSGGIINIILKKGIKIGRFGSISTGMNQGVAGNRFAGFSLNNSGDKSSIYLNANYNNSGMAEDISSIRYLAHDTNLNQSATTRQKSNQGYIGFGINHEAAPRMILSYDTRINGNMRDSDAKNLTFMENGDQRFSENNNLNHNKSGFLNMSQDFGMNYKLDTLGSEWDTKIGYNYNSNTTAQDYTTNFIFPTRNPIVGEGDNTQGRHFLLLQSDITYFLPQRMRLETGFKSTYQHYNSKADYFFSQDGNLINDPSRTNSFNYQENINAAYIQASIPVAGTFLLKAGLRLEHTHMMGNQTIPSDTSFIVSRVDLFPYVFMSRKIIEMAGYELRGFMIYRRTIGRPGYQSLNPSIRYIDQYLYEAGNPALKPQFTDNVEINISLDDMPIFAIGRNHTNDIFTGVVYQDEVFPDVAVRTFDNVGKSRETYFQAVGAIPPVSRYFFVAGAQYNLNEYDGLYENQPLSFTRGSWRFFTFHSLSLGSNTKLSMMGFMMLRGQQNFYELNTFGQLNFGLNQFFMNRKLQVSLSARDVLRTMVTQFELNQGSVLMKGERYSDNQRFGINLRYNFGVRKKQERQQMFNMDMDV